MGLVPGELFTMRQEAFQSWSRQDLMPAELDQIERAISSWEQNG